MANEVDTLHYIYDPLCGWCYAAEHMFELACGTSDPPLRIQLHGGGLFEDQQLSDAKRAYIRDADQRIAELTGQVFGQAYLDGTLSDPDTRYDSSIPIAAVLAVQERNPAAGPGMLMAMQQAHYRHGEKITDPSALAGIAQRLGIERAAFLESFARRSASAVHQHIAETRQLMHRVGAGGFPTFVLQSGNAFSVLEHQQSYRSPKSFLRNVQAARSNSVQR